MRWIFVLAVIGALAVAAILAVSFSSLIPAGTPGLNLPNPPAPAPSPAAAGIPVLPPNTTTPVPPGQDRMIAAPENMSTATPRATTPVPVTSPTPHGVVTVPVTSPALPFPVPAGPAPGDPYAISTTDLATRVHELINRERASNNLNALGTDPALAALAVNHSEDMAANHYFAHENPAGQDPTARGEAAGYICRKDYGSYYTYGIAENIYQNNRYSAVTYYSDGRYVYEWNDPEMIARSTVDGWMNSPGHRKNILTATFDREGIGVAVANDDKIYITEDFC